MSAFDVFLLILLGFIIGGLFTSWVFKDDDDTTVRSWEKWNEDRYREEYYEQLDENTRLLRRNVELRNQILEYRKGNEETTNQMRKRFGLEPVFSDNVNHPNHYTQGNIETIDYIKDKLTDEEFRGFVKGNVLKYVSREGLKNGDEDLKKSKWYLEELIEMLE